MRKLAFLIMFILTSVLILLFDWYYRSDYYFRQLSKEEPLGPKVNEKRIQFGVPIIEDDWFTNDLSTKRHGFLRNVVEYQNPWVIQVWSGFNKDTSGHQWKKIYRDLSMRPEKEVDRFVVRDGSSVFSVYSYSNDEILHFYINNELDTVYLDNQEFLRLLYPR